MKFCNRCKSEKEIEFFHKSSKSKDGHKSICKSCVLEKEKVRLSRPEVKEKVKAYRLSIPKEKIKENKKNYYLSNREKILLKNSKYRKENTNKIKESGKRYRENNYDSLKEKKKKYRNSSEYKLSQKEWRLQNKDKVKEYREKYLKSKNCKTDKKNWYKSLKKRSPHIIAWRTLLNNTLKRFGRKKEDETIKLLGYSAIQLKEHIENLFLEGMCWENYGDWHIDHIKMVSTFDKETPINIVNSLDNLRPLWRSDNCSRKLN